jgi:uncharacterized membrane protein
MTSEFLDVVVVVSALGSALVGGIFFAFSTFVMQALGRLAPEQGIAAMQTINVTVLNPWFFTVFFGTGIAAAAVLVFALMNWATPAAASLAVGAMLYIVGGIAVTMAFNVPLNNALARADANHPDGVALWRHYLRRWTFWNHVRTVAALAAAALLLLERFPF